MPFSPAPTQQAYNDAVIQARQDWLKEEQVTVQAVQQAYAKAINDMAYDLSHGYPSGAVSRDWYTEVMADLDKYRNNISAESLAAIRSGVVLSYSTGLDTADPHIEFLDQYTNGAMHAQKMSMKETEALSYYARNGKNGLVLSENVWGSSAAFNYAMTNAVQTAVISGQSAKDLAKELDAMVARDPNTRAPNGLHPTSLEQRRALGGWPKDVSYESTRVARTEINNAGREGTIAAHSQSPFYFGIQWVRSKVPYPCTICDTLAKGDPNVDEKTYSKAVRDLPGFWPAGNEPPNSTNRPHPNCRCVVLPVYAEPDGITAIMDLYVDSPSTVAAAFPKVGTWSENLKNQGLLGPNVVAPAAPAVVPTPQAAATKRTRKPKTPTTSAKSPTRIPEPPSAGGWGANEHRTIGASALNDPNKSPSEYKNMVANDLADRLVTDPAFRTHAVKKNMQWAGRFATTNPQTGRASGYVDEADLVADLTAAGKTQAEIDKVLRDVVYQQANDMVHQWAITSADNNPTSLALQLAAKEEFGLGTEARTQHFSRRKAWARAKQEYADNQDAYRAFTRAVYENTQDKLKAEGVDELTLHRGMGWETEKQMNNAGIPSTARGDVVPASIKMQPISSYAYDHNVASGFASGTHKAVATTTVPRERIYSTMATGPGCKDETEVVVLGGPNEHNVGAYTGWSSQPTADELVEGKKKAATGSSSVTW
jgi:hypothetical protein